MADSVSLAGLSAKLKDYALEHSDTILTRIVNTNTPDIFTPMANIKDEVPLVSLMVGDILQPGGKDTFTPTADAITFKDRTLKVRAAKVDLQFGNAKIQAWYKSYLGQVDGGHIDPNKIPLEAYVFGEIIKRAQKNRIQAMFKGVYNASGTTPLSVCDGVLPIITTDVASGAIPAGNVTTGAAVTNSNAVDEVDKLMDLIVANDDLSSEDMVLCMSSQNLRKYNKDYQATFGALPYNTSFEKQTVDGTNVTLMGIPHMNGSDRMFATPKGFLFWGYDLPGGDETIRVENALRNISLMMDLQVGVNYGVGEYMFVNNYLGIV